MLYLVTKISKIGNRAYLGLCPHKFTGAQVKLMWKAEVINKLVTSLCDVKRAYR